MACFDGNYPIELPAADLIGKHLLEGVGRRATSVAALEEDYPDGDREVGPPLVASPGGAGALHHP